MNGDGYDDFVAGGVFRLTVLLSQVDAQGGWQGLGEPTYIGGTAETIIVEDLNGDGHLDIATTATAQWLDNPQGYPPDPSFANRDYNSVHIYTGNGHGEFSESARYDGTSFLLGVDYDDDGDIDLLTRYSSPKETQRYVLLNESDGNAISFRVGGSFAWEDLQPYTVSPSYDVNGDGISDKLDTDYAYDWGNFYSENETFYQLGRADGSFDNAIPLASLYYGNWREFGLGGSLPTTADPYVYDVDGNAENDFVHIRGNAIRLVRQGRLEGYSMVATNFPSSSDRLYYSRFFDINGDGLLDYVAAEDEFPLVGRYIQEGKPDGAFGESYFLTEDEIQSAFEDFRIIEPSNTEPHTYHKSGGVAVTVYELSSTSEPSRANQIASFQLPISNQSGVQAGTSGPSHAAQHVDVDGDGDLDIVVGHGSGVAIVFAVGKGDFDADGKLTMDDFAILAANFGSQNTRPEQGDMNHDGDVDFEDFVAFAHAFRPL